MVIYNKHKNAIHLNELVAPYEANINNLKSTTQNKRSTLNLSKTMQTMDPHNDLKCFKVRPSWLITLKNVRHIDKVSSFVGHR